MPKALNRHPDDRTRRLHLRYQVGDPRFVALEQLLVLAAPGRANGVLLAALELGAEVLLARRGAVSSDPAPVERSHRVDAAAAEKEAVVRAPAINAPLAAQPRETDAPVARYSETALRHVAMYGGDD